MLRNNLIANFVGQGWTAVVTVAFVPVYIHLLGIESYALIGIFAILQAWLILLDLGMAPTLGREMSRFSAGAHSPDQIRDLLRSVEVICGVVALLAMIVITVGAPFVAADWLNTTLPYQTVRNALTLMGVVVAMRFFEAIYRSALFGLERQVWYNSASVVLATLRSGGAALVLWLVSPTIIAFFLWQLAISALALVLLIGKLYRVLPRPSRPTRFTRAALSEIWRFAAGMIGINVLALLLSQADKVILSRALPLTIFGFYSLAATMCSVIVSATGPITQAIFPVLTRAHAADDVAAFNAAYHQAAQLVSVAAATIAVLLVLFPHEVVQTWSGNPLLATNVAPALRVLAAATFFSSLMQIPYFATLALGRTSFSIRVNLVAVILVLPALLIAVPRFGALGAAYVSLALMSGIVLFATPVLHRVYLPGQFVPWLAKDVAGPVVAALAVAITARLIAPPIEASRLIWALYLAATGLAVAIAAVSGAQTIRRSAVNFIRGFRRLDTAPVIDA